MSTATCSGLQPTEICEASSHANQLPFQVATRPDSLLALAALICVINVARSFIFRPILKELGARLGSYTNGSKWVAQNEERIDNFSSFTFRFLFRLVVTGLGLMELWQSPDWWYKTPLLWEGYPHHHVSNAIQILYLLQLAYHLEDLGVVLLQGHSNRKDFTAMMIHHVVTALLLFGSTHLHLTRIGTIVSTLHAIADVPKDFAKVAKTMEWDLASKLGFGALVLTWFVARLYLYPFVYVRSAFLEFTPLIDGGMSLVAARGFQVLLIILLLLNLMWFQMMLKLIYQLASSGKAEDPTLIEKHQPTELCKGYAGPDCVVSNSSTEDTDSGDSTDGSSDDGSDR